MASAPPKPIRNVLIHLLSAFAGKSVPVDVDNPDDDEDDESADEDFAMYDDLEDYSSSTVRSSLDLTKLQR